MWVENAYFFHQYFLDVIFARRNFYALIERALNFAIRFPDNEKVPVKLHSKAARRKQRAYTVKAKAYIWAERFRLRSGISFL